jgi:hypothetical protein
MNWKGRGDKSCLYVRQAEVCVCVCVCMYVYIREDNIKTDLKELGWGVTA